MSLRRRARSAGSSSTDRTRLRRSAIFGSWGALLIMRLEACKHPEQRVLVHWLGDVGVDLCLGRGLGLFHDGHHHHRDLARRWINSQVAKHLPTSALRNEDVERDDAGMNAA